MDLEQVFDSFVKECNDQEQAGAIDILENFPQILQYLGEHHRSCLTLALINRCPEVVDYILEHDQSMVSQLDVRGWSTLLHAADQSMEESALKLLKTGLVDVNHSSFKTKNTALITASRKGLVNLVKALLETDKVHTWHLDKHNHSAFSYACIGKQWEIADMLLDYDSNLIGLGAPFLHRLFEYEEPESKAMIVRLINSGKLDLHEKDSFANTYLSFSCYHEYEDLAFDLIKKDPTLVNTVDGDMETPLLIASYKCSEDLVMALLETGNSLPEKENEDGETAFDLMIQKGMIKAINKMLELNRTAVTPFIDSTDASYIMKACEAAQGEVVKLLFAHGFKFPFEVKDDKDYVIAFLTERRLYSELAMIMSREMNEIFCKYPDEFQRWAIENRGVSI